MCGIAGFVYADPQRAVDPVALTRMADAMAHRGPDGHGIWHHGSVGLAHRRLAIIDLTGGAQPMISPSTGVVLTFNGEIYNFRALGQELRASGVEVRDASDTAVLLAGYDHWGDAVVDRLRGMFAFAVWDPRRRRVFAARDRLGIKPFYYRWDGQSLAFASEVTALLALSHVPRVVNETALLGYLRRQYVPGPSTIIEGIQQLPPGRTMSWTAGESPVERRYWSPRPSAPHNGASRARDAADLADALVDVVDCHLVSDVPVGALLSGGVDSSVIVACAVSRMSEPMHTFSVGFDQNPEIDERAAARRVSERFRTIHHEHVVTVEEVIERLPELTSRMDEPLADYAALPVFLLAELAAREVKVVLTGEGADELFGGYRRYRRQRLPAWFHHRLPSYQPSTMFSAAQLSELTGRTEARENAVSAAASREGLDAFNALLAHDIEGWLPDNLLTKIDRMTMLCSLEARVPYLDHLLVEQALAVPGRHKMHSLLGADKLALREAATRWLPPEVTNRTKHGLKAPVDSWFQRGLLALARDALSGSSSRIRSRFDGRGIDRLLDAQDAGERGGHRIWGLLVYELWSRAHGVF